MTKQSKLYTVLLIILFLLSYAFGFLYYVPLYTTLIISFIVQIVIWFMISNLVLKANNSRTTKIFDTLCWYKIMLFTLGYLFWVFNIYMPRFSVELDIFFGFLLITQVQPFGFMLSTLFKDIDSDIPYILTSTILVVLFSLSTILPYHIGKKKFRTKQNQLDQSGGRRNEVRINRYKIVTWSAQGTVPCAKGTPHDF